MKTLLRNHFFIYNKPPLVSWRNIGKRLPSWLSGPQSLGEFTLTIKKTLILIAHAVKDRSAGLLALIRASEVNARIYGGLSAVGIVSPLSACAYLLFDQSVRIAGWYHVNNFYLFMLLGPYLGALALTIGVFLLFPHGAKRAYTLLIPAGYIIGKIIWLYYTNSNADYWSVPHWTYFAVGFLLSLVVFLSLDFLTWRKFHRADSFDKRLEGIYNVIDELPAEKIVSMFRQTWREKKEFHKQY